MRFLLDTHTFLWFIGGDERLPLVSRELIADDINEIFMSVASLWEIAVKLSLRKLTLARPFEELIPEQLIANDFEVLPIDIKALSLVSKLPFHHRDPFDRLLIAQAILEDIPIIGRDSRFSEYSIELVWRSYPN